MVSSYNFARANLKSFAQKTFEFPVRLDEILITSAAVGNLRFSLLRQKKKIK